MDEDAKSYAVPSSNMPPENRVSCAMESVDVMRRIVALLMLRAGINNLNYTTFELNMAPVDTLLVRRDKPGNVTVTLES